MEEKEGVEGNEGRCWGKCQTYLPILPLELLVEKRSVVAKPYVCMQYNAGPSESHKFPPL